MSDDRRRVAAWRRRGVCVALAAICIAFVPAAAQAADDLGFVLEATGTWQIAEPGGAPKPLIAGQSVKAGHQVTPSAPDAHLTIVLLDGDRLVCPKDARCAGPLAGKDSGGGKPGFAKRLVRAVSGLFSTPDRYATTMSRGEELHESIGILNRGRLHLGDALEALPEGRYRVTLQAIGSAYEPTGDPLTVDIASRAQGPRGMPSAGKLAPGLYRISLESGADAWVYLSSVGRYRSAVGEFREAKQLVAGWKDVPARSVRTFLRASLDTIAGGAPDTKPKSAGAK